jgi:hypothetical protein
MRPDVRSRHIGRIQELAGQLDQLAAVAEQKPIKYEQFEIILREFHRARCFPLNELVSDVARAVQQQKATTT